MEGMYLIRKSASAFDRAMARGDGRRIWPGLLFRAINVDCLHQSSVLGCLVARVAGLQLVPP